MGFGKKKSAAPPPAPTTATATPVNESVPDDASQRGVQERREPSASKSLLDPAMGEDPKKNQGMLS